MRNNIGFIVGFKKKQNKTQHLKHLDVALRDNSNPAGRVGEANYDLCPLA